ncbi:carbohydrate ABC transporter membrane protein 2, CUT1 family [Geodermatophilus saharensis]|uniref:Carbohydrate ABC transporter membrane protein 2, CUT1 family n=1 Tax=Geodermatophilus saharensis TaxID=1137994 RepID=A0A239G828_9ACTN|nr:carbohydrate ABC transporter membrane protein 2, CUT1 family [Geodermatophilus saharensis]
MSTVAPVQGEQSGTPSRSRLARRGATQESPLSVAVAMIVLIGAAVYFLLPVYWLVVNSTKSQPDLINSNGFWFADWNLGQNLSELFSRDGGVFLRWALNSLLYAGLGAAVGTLLAAMAGYALAKYEFRGRELLFSIVLGGVLVPATALALPLFLLFARVDLTNTFWAVFLPSIVSPFGVYLSRIFAAASVPDELIDAARLDGASEWRIFSTIAARLMSPALVTIFLFQFVVIWNNFLLPLIMLRNSSLWPITFGLFSWQSQVSRDPQLQILTVTGSLVSVIPLIITFLVLQRYWRAGLAAGSDR